MADLSHARAAKARLRTALAAHDGVCGVGLAVADGGYLLQVNVVSAGPEVTDGVPSAVDGVPVRLRVVGPVTAQATAAQRPAAGVAQP